MSMTAYELGQAAFNDKINAPAYDTVFINTFCTGPINQGHGERMKAYAQWWDGYHDAQDAQLQKDFPEMYVTI